MTLHTSLRRTLASAASALLMVAGLATPAVATPAPAQNSVLFGDSIPANPVFGDFVVAKKIPQHPANQNGCTHDPSPLANQVAVVWQMPVDDYSCAGASVASSTDNLLKHQVDRALHAKTLNGNTKNIVLIIGFNDTYPRLTKGENWTQITNAYVQGIGVETARMRKAAPNARIRIVGYPSITDNGTGTCLLRAPNNLKSYEKALGAPLNDVEVNIVAMQRKAANTYGLGFVDTRAQTMGHGMCASDGQRYMGGLVDFGDHINFPAHLTATGKNVLAGIVARS